MKNVVFYFRSHQIGCDDHKILPSFNFKFKNKTVFGILTRKQSDQFRSINKTDVVVTRGLSGPRVCKFITPLHSLAFFYANLQKNNLKEGSISRFLNKLALEFSVPFLCKFC